MFRKEIPKNSSFEPSELKYDNVGDETLVIKTPQKTEEVQSISLSTSYCTEWEKLFKKPKFLKALREYGIEGKLRSCRFRSVCWKLYLEVLPDEVTQWQDKTNEWRQRYDRLKDSLIVNPRKTEEIQERDVKLNNPLSQAEESPWNRFFQDNELRLTIKQDVIRTFPDVEFFKDADLHTKMTDILFCYSRLNENLSYRQGMHELLAPLIFVLHCDHQAFLHATEVEQVGSVLAEILDPRYIEHDAFALFCQIMETAEHWYVSKEISPTVRPKSVAKSMPFARPQDMNPSNVIVNKLTRIQDYLLKKYDPELHMYLEKMEIPPQIYGIRWLRLLFGREFPMQDLLVVWDAVFADSISFDLVDYIFVAMLLFLRDALLSSDYPTCLHFLMKYPPVGDIHYFIQKARFLRDPNEHYCPPHYTYQKPANFLHSSYGDVFPGLNGIHSMKQTAASKGGSKITEKASSFMSSGFASLTRKFSSGSKARRQMSLPAPATLNKATSRSTTAVNEQQSPSSDILPISGGHYSSHSRKGSSASMSQLEDRVAPYPGLFGAASSSHQCLAQSDGPGGPPGGSMSSLEEAVPAGEQLQMEQKYGSSGVYRRNVSGGAAGGGRGYGKRNVTHTARNADLEHRISFLLGRLNDLENMCMKCSDKMDLHIDKLQCEMLRKEMENDDELLLALAGLKVVKDVLKGELKPSALSFDEIRINDNHYQEDSMATTGRPGQPMSPSNGHSNHKTSDNRVFTPDVSPDLSSDTTDFTSPEDGTSNMVDGGRYGYPEDVPRTPSSILHHDLLKQKEVELSNLETVVNGNKNNTSQQQHGNTVERYPSQ